MSEVLPEGSIATMPASAAADTAPMSIDRPLAARALIAALILGALGDGLLRASEPGVNVTIWVAAALSGAAWLALRRERRTPRRTASASAIAVLLFAAMFTWRAAPALAALNFLAMLTAFGMLAFALMGWPPLAAGGILDHVLGAGSLALSGAVGAPLLVLRDGGLSLGAGGTRRGHLLAAVRGLLIAVPLLVVFGALLASADARFERLLDTVIDADLQEVIGHVAFAGLVAWVTAGYFRAATVAVRPLGVDEVRQELPRPTLGIVEVVVPLALLDLLFLTFVVLQLPYLFGGAAHVQQAAGLTVAEYARRGFFELVVVAALLLPVLLAGAGLLRRDQARDRRIFRALGSTTLLLLAMMMASAVQRMTLYAQSFGLSEDRIFATAIMAWLAAVFALFAATIMRGRSRGFVVGAVVAGWATVATLDVLNPQAIVVRTNTERAVHGASFDVAYATMLGADAVPALCDAAAALDGATRSMILEALVLRGWDPATAKAADDWRSWNYSRAVAKRIETSVRSSRTNGACVPPA